jgi:hypothetical protein
MVVLAVIPCTEKLKAPAKLTMTRRMWQCHRMCAVTVHVPRTRCAEMYMCDNRTTIGLS